MGYTTEHMGRIPKAVMPDTGHLEINNDKR